MKVINFMTCLVFSFVIVECKKTYRVGIYEDDHNLNIGKYVSMIRKAADENVDVLVLPSPTISISDAGVEKTDFNPQRYEANIKSLSEAARESSIYVVVHLYRGQTDGLERVNVVLDRNGEVVANYQKPLISNTNEKLEIGSFTSNFGVLFGLLFEEDLAIHNIGGLKNVKNFIVLGRSIDESLIDLSSSWAYITNSNIITSDRIFGTENISIKGSKLVIADLEKEGSGMKSISASHSSQLSPLDLSHFIIRPLDLEASRQGYEDHVCHEKFCCGFFVKSNAGGSAKNTVNYALAAFDGLQNYGDHNLGVHNCAIYAYTGLYKHAVDFGSNQNHTDIKFDRIVITCNKTNYITSLPVFVSSNVINEKQFFFNDQNSKVTIEVTNIENLSAFGIYGRNYTKDYVDVKYSESSSISWDIYDYINSENVGEFFDYLWIRIRILLFIVSIYILEMM